MADEVQDIFGKIDALLERRDADILGEKCAEDADIPRLTDVIETSDSPATDGGCSVERRYAVRRRPLATDLAFSGLTDEQLNKLFVTIEKHMIDIFSRHQLQIQADLLKVIRDELTTLSAEK